MLSVSAAVKIDELILHIYLGVHSKTPPNEQSVSGFYPTNLIIEPCQLIFLSSVTLHRGGISLPLASQLLARSKKFFGQKHIA